MKATELMVGDWVCLKDDTKYELPLKIDGVLTNDISLEGEGFLGGFDGLIRPIPITPEMLVKNGWKIYDDDFLEEVYPSFCYKEVNHLEWKCGTISILTDYEKDNERVYSDIIIPCEYVHQLQQILRLAGMTELANNFKV